MARQRTLVYMTIEWDDALSTDPRKWDWDAMISEDDSGDRVTNTGSYRIVSSMTDDGVREMMDAITQIAGDMISDRVSEEDEMDSV